MSKHLLFNKINKLFLMKYNIECCVSRNRFLSNFTIIPLNNKINFCNRNNINCSNIFGNVSFLHRNNLIYVRNKYNSAKSSKSKNSEEDSDDESEDFQDERDSKVVKTRVNSLRADLLIKAGLGMARNKVETIFYESKVRVNGLKIQKKSIQLNVGDEIDVIKGFSNVNPLHLMVSRVIILSATQKDENILINLRRFKNLVIDNYEAPNQWKSSEKMV